MHIGHEHTHNKDAHSSENNHSHAHEHGHTHSHTPEGGASKELALLKYMLEHNRQHTRELSEAAAKFKEAGETAAAELIADAVHSFGHGNDKLEKAVKSLSGEAH